MSFVFYLTYRPARSVSRSALPLEWIDSGAAASLLKGRKSGETHVIQIQEVTHWWAVLIFGTVSAVSKITELFASQLSTVAGLQTINKK